MNSRPFQVGDFVEVDKDGVTLQGEVIEIKETPLGIQTLTIKHEYGICKAQGGLTRLLLGNESWGK